MNKLFDLIMEKKWAAVIIFLLLSSLIITGPVWGAYKVTGVVKEELKPIILEIQEIKDSIDHVSDIQFKQLYGSAIAAYDKFDTIEDLENSSSSQNKNAIQLGLEVEEVRALLLLANRAKTMMFMEYFQIGV